MRGWDVERDACGIGFVANGSGRPGRDVVELAVEGLCRLRHRGAIDADARTGDGAGVLLPIPRRFLAREAGPISGRLEDAGLAMVFARGDDRDDRAAVADACTVEGIRILAWREVPAEPTALGARGRSTMPRILQAILEPPPGASAREAERLALRARRRVERVARGRGLGLGLYVASLSFRTVTYKALVAADQLSAFYPDLSDPALETWFAIFHQRYSTNTAPTWERAQPFRMLCHNGEINTIAGNVHRMCAREGRLGLPNGADEELFSPVVDEAGSDSAMFDEAVELLSREGPKGGRDVRHVIAMLVPAAWASDPISMMRCARSTTGTSPCSSRGTVRPRWSSPTGSASGRPWTGTGSGRSAMPPATMASWPAHRRPARWTRRGTARSAEASSARGR